MQKGHQADALTVAGSAGEQLDAGAEREGEFVLECAIQAVDTQHLSRIPQRNNHQMTAIRCDREEDVT